ncbi:MULTISPECIES: restriction endonuclease subunit S [unclassified Serratia (in: enterobacteria)]|uniref:restriction endonuclease subunit S n=1 Tax=unclassified Serratia (in: enterobacteria) TaxID=2647522 RepID=UPI0005076402|nr:MULTISPECIES: restriction endonuclease subunit S [unclassified Serratia (in: enterobacteria)]KFK96607.1 restriction modification system DNA specificity subunit [Serratia sp. Ag2]KFK99773.1 restriction modification system DNA specificity subunit [Serratia sp. Ag1]
MKLPETWVQTTVRAVVDDIQPGFAQKPGEEDEGSTPQIRTHNVTPDGKISLEGIKHITASEKEAARYSLAIGDVVFNNTNSEEWVGKTAVFDQEGEFVFSNHMTRLRVRKELVLPEYLAGYLQMLWSMGYSKTRAKRWVSQAGIESDTLASFKIPLPTLHEQQRIVDVLQQAEVVTKAKKSISDQVDHLVRTAYWEYFSDWYTADGLIDPVRISDYVADSQYGVSEAMGETGTHAVLRMNSMTASGWLDLTDLKYASLSKKDIESTKLHDGDLLFNRTNSRELVGKCAIWRPVEGEFSFASYLVRIRLKPEMLPEFLWTTLNSAYGKYRLFNSAKQAVSMANVSPTDLGRITVPLPPLPLQQKFSELVREIEALRAQMLGKLEMYSELLETITQQTLVGQLTANWRDAHTDKILEAAKARDALLCERGTKIVNTAANIVIASTVQGDANVYPTRHWLFSELSEFQRRVLTAFTEYCQESGPPLLVEDPEVFARFCDDATVTERLQAFGQSHGNRIRRSLSQLASLGLIAKITLPKQDLESGELDYLKAFRPLRPEEFTRMADVQALRKALSSSVDQRHYYFEVQLDYETSAHAGAKGMFQVIAVEDEDGQDFTHLVNLGTHYASLNELKKDIANALKVEAWYVDLEEV